MGGAPGKLVTFQMGRKTYIQKCIKECKQIVLRISVQEAMDQSGYRLSCRLAELCSARDSRVHGR